MVREGWEMVCYADDLVVLCRTEEEAQRALAYLRQWAEAAELTVHPTKTRIVNAESEGFDFLGGHFRGSKKWPRKKSVNKLRDKLRPLTQRNNGGSLSDIIAKVNPILRGWYGYFQTSCPSGLKGTDGWIRRRLRALLRKRPNALVTERIGTTTNDGQTAGLRHRGCLVWRRAPVLID